MAGLGILSAGSVVIKAAAAQANGSLTAFELLISLNGGQPAHTHLPEDFKAADAMPRGSTGGSTGWRSDGICTRPR